MEIERKYLIDLESVPFDYKSYPAKVIEQGYLSTDPVVRVRKSNDKYILTYKGKGEIEREEYNLPLTKEAYEHLVKKSDGRIIKKIRYNIPYKEKYLIELDVFLGDLEPLVVAEVEFESRQEADTFVPPDWFGEDVSTDNRYKNSYLSQK
ncbi:MAG: CYTH domain-containing protein [Lachnospiraceae bacterium]|nr:CYTH domain-containing protein [Lachnospiraceae bacterium]